MPGTVKSELLPDADRSYKCERQEKVCRMQNLLLDKSHFITVVLRGPIFDFSDEAPRFKIDALRLWSTCDPAELPPFL